MTDSIIYDVAQGAAGLGRVRGFYVCNGKPDLSRGDAFLGEWKPLAAARQECARMNDVAQFEALEKQRLRIRKAVATLLRLRLAAAIEEDGSRLA